MPWARFDDQLAFHAKVVKAGNDGTGVWLRMTTYCCGHLTDGFVPNHIAHLMDPRGKAIERAACAGLIEIVADGYRVHDFHDFNPQATEIKEHRAKISEARRKAGQIGGIASGKVRSNEANAKQNEANAKQVASQATKQTEAPSDPIRSDPEEADPETHTPRARAHVDAAKVDLQAWVQDGWRVRLKVLQVPGLLEVVPQIETLAAHLKRPAQEVADEALLAFVEYRAACTPPKIPAPTGHAMATHWARIEERLLSGKPFGERSGSREYSHFNAPREAVKKSGEVKL